MLARHSTGVLADYDEPETFSERAGSGRCGGAVRYVRLRWFQYRIVTGMYVLSLWESALLNVIFAGVLWLVFQLCSRVGAAVYSFA